MKAVCRILGFLAAGFVTPMTGLAAEAAVPVLVEPSLLSSTSMGFPELTATLTGEAGGSPQAAPAPAGSVTPAEPQLKLSGNRNTTLRYQHYSGLSPAASGFYQSGFSRHETTRLKVSGSVLETVKVEGEIFQNDVDFDNRYSLMLATRNYELFLGEFPASFEGSEFTLFNRSLQGARLTGEIPGGGGGPPSAEFTVVASSPRGRPYYERIFGQDTQGPYRLAHFPVVMNSERIEVDKVPQVRNVDYEINYITGQVTFKKRIVEARSLIEYRYEARETLYPRSLYGVQGIYYPSGTDSVGIVVLDERDKKDPATYEASGIPASAHSVVGTTLKHDGEFVRAGGEYAASFFDPNSFEKGLETGNACKGELELERSGIVVGGDVKRIEPRYRSMGNTALGSDFLGWASHGSFGVGRAFSAGGEHRQRRTILDGRADRETASDAKAEFSPEGWPQESYRYYQSDEKFDGNFERTERRHDARVGHKLGLVTMGGGYERQELRYRDGAQPDQTWDAGKADLGLAGLSWVTMSLNGEVRKGITEGFAGEPSRRFDTHIADANIGFTPNERYYLGGANHWQKKTGEPSLNTLRTDAKAKPVDQVSAEANFSQETLQMYYLGAPKDARTSTRGGLLDLEPVKDLSFLYQPSLRQTFLGGIKPAVNLDRREGGSARWSVGSSLSAEVGYLQEAYRLRDTSVADLRIQTSQDADTWDTSLRLAPVSAFSSAVTYTDKAATKSQLNLSSPSLYDSRTTRDQVVEVTAKPQLESRLGLDAAYRFERFKQDGNQDDAESLPAYAISPVAEQIKSFSLINDYSRMRTHEHTVRAGVSYQWMKEIISTANADYDLKVDRLGVIADVETFAGGAGLTYRIAAFKVEGAYRCAQSRGGAKTRQQALSGGLDFVPSPQVRWTNRAEYSVTSFPSTAFTDITSSLEVSF